MMKRKGLLLLMATLALSLLMAGIGQADFVLNGTTLKVGVNTGGGLVDIPDYQGITYNPGPLPNDYSLPGIPWEFVSIGVNGSFQASGVPGASVNPWNMTLVNESAGSNLQAHTFGAPFIIGNQSLAYLETIFFDTLSSKVRISMKIINPSTTDTLNSVYISRGIDPDQESFLGYGPSTSNVIPGATSTMVTATGVNTGLFVNMDAFPESGAVAAISGPDGGYWATNPTILGVGGLVNGAVAGNPKDYSINMTWFLGDIKYDQSRTIDFDYKFGQVPVPPSVWLFASGLIGLVGLRRKFGK